MSSYSHLNIALLKRELKDAKRTLKSLSGTITSHQEIISAETLKKEKQEKRLFPNDVAIRKSLKSINIYTKAVRSLERDRKYWEREIEIMEATLTRKRKIRFARNVAVVLIVLGGFVLKNGEGEVKASSKETSSVSEKEDKEKTQKATYPSYEETLDDKGNLFDKILGFLDEKPESLESSDFTK